MADNRIRIIATAVLALVLVAVAGAGITVFSFLSPILQGEVALVNPDGDDRAALADMQKELADADYAEPEVLLQTTAPEQSKVAPVETKKTGGKNMNGKGSAVTRTTPAAAHWLDGNIPSAILTVDQKDAAVTNMLLIMDGDFYLVSLQQQEYTLYPIPGELYVPVQGLGWTTLNKAYQAGGIAAVANTVNTALNMDVQHYVYWNSDGLWRVSDLMGGLEVNLTKAEAEAMNKQLSTAYTPGTNTLWEGGLDAYAKLDVNGTPTDHWKSAAKAIWQKAKADKRTGQLMNAAKNGLSTDVSLSTLKGLAERYLDNDARIHVNNLLAQQCTLQGKGANTTAVADLPKAAEKLHKAIYG